MTSFLYSIFGFILAIGILVTVHEYGHYKVARLLGVKVLRFSIGFGKPLFSWRRGADATEYWIATIPLGGYVKMLDEAEGDVPANDAHRAFNRQSLAARSAIAAAGPAANFLFAVFAIWLLLVTGSDDIPPVVGEVQPGSVAEASGFRDGDRITAVDGRAMQTWNEHQFYLLHQAMKENVVAFGVQGESGDARLVHVDFGGLNQYSIADRRIGEQIGIWPQAPPAVVSEVVADSPAAAAGLQAGDRIVAADDRPIADWVDLVQYVTARPGQPIAMLIRRDGTEFVVTVTPQTVQAEGVEYGRIGLYQPPLQSARLRYGLLAAIPAALDYNWRLANVSVRSLWRLASARMPVDNLSGPITIAVVAGRVVESGFAQMLKFLAIISISLGLINLLPIPMLDGGHLLYFAYEAVAGRPPSMKARIVGMRIGVLLLLFLMSFVFYNDIMRLL